MSLKTLQLKSNIKDYQVFFVDSSNFIKKLKSSSNVLFVIDENVWRFHKEGALCPLQDSDKIILPISEERKTLETVSELYDQIMRRTPKRNLTLISIGGGIMQDISGYVASTLYRGVNWIFIPTTLLAQADSCIGAKTSLNYKDYKNLMGTFFPPSEIYIYTPFLKTQEAIDYFSGLGEIVKLYLIGGEKDTQALISFLPLIIKRDHRALLKSVEESLLIKKQYIEDDEFDTGKRNMLNFGHCFGHALETATNFAIPHGQAVVLGIVLANIIAQKRGLLSKTNEDFILKNVLQPVLKVDMEKVELDSEKIIQAMQQDKKRTGAGLALVMMKNGYKMLKVNDLTTVEAKEAVKEYGK